MFKRLLIAAEFAKKVFRLILLAIKMHSAGVILLLRSLRGSREKLLLQLPPKLSSIVILIFTKLLFDFTVFFYPIIPASYLT